MNEIFVQDLAIVLVAAGLVTVLFKKFKQPVVLGYILAGFIIGPHTPPFSYIKDETSIHALADLGVILLMFSLGLHFNLKKIRAVGLSALTAAFLEIIFMIWIGFEAGQWFGWNETDSLFLGGMLAISSTTIIVKALHDMGLYEEKFASLIFGILIMEDLLGIAMIALLSGIALTGEVGVMEIGDTLARLGIFLVSSLVLGLLVIPGVLRYVHRLKSQETMLIAILGLCFGVSIFSAHLGYSIALGAFVIGAIVAEIRDIGNIGQLVEPVKDMFSAIFFVAVGLMINPHILGQYWVPVVVITLAVIIGKVLTCTVGTFVAGNDLNTSLKVGLGLAQIGEFSFIIAAMGLTLNVTSSFLYPIVVTVSAITTLTTPYLIKSSDFWVGLFDKVLPKKLFDFLNRYGVWMNSLGAAPVEKTGVQKSRGGLQYFINLALIAAVFIATDHVAENAAVYIPVAHLQWAEDWNDPFWFAAMLLSSPMIIATVRKLYRVGGIPLVIPGMLGLGGLILVLSSLMYPKGYLFAILAAIVIATWILYWRVYLDIYGKAKGKIRKTLRE
ncbi:MAG: cation:proton antiporter [Deltaproteobacteria bacterium]|nr:cation:proton antiporter [Deltaproteobacteria bacterium]